MRVPGPGRRTWILSPFVTPTLSIPCWSFSLIALKSIIRAASVDANSSLVVKSGLGDGRFLRAGRYGYLLGLVRRYSASLSDLAVCWFRYVVFGERAERFDCPVLRVDLLVLHVDLCDHYLLFLSRVLHLSE
jgi:hypothetical protein